MTSSTQIRIPAELCEAAQQRFGSRFGSVENLVTFLLQQLLQDGVAAMDEEERKRVDSRLKDLGYL